MPRESPIRTREGQGQVTDSEIDLSSLLLAAAMTASSRPTDRQQPLRCLAHHRFVFKLFLPLVVYPPVLAANIDAAGPSSVDLFSNQPKVGLSDSGLGGLGSSVSVTPFSNSANYQSFVLAAEQTCLACIPYWHYDHSSSSTLMTAST